jgi:hypothetical protein
MMSITRRCLAVAGEFRVVHIEQVARKEAIGAGRGRSVPG